MCNMYEKMKVNDLIKDNEDYNMITGLVDRDQEVDPMYGIDTVKITAEDIESLKSGKCLYFTDGEYATVLYYE